MREEQIKARPAKGSSRMAAERRKLLAAMLRREGIELHDRNRIARRWDGRSDAPLSFAQQRLWFVDQLEPGCVAYNVPAALRLRGPFETSAFVWALEELMARHAILSAFFSSGTQGPQQRIEPRLALPFQRIALAGLGGERPEQEARRLAREEARRPFDLSRAPLWRAILLELGSRDHVLLFTMHHIISDGWSRHIVARELRLLYEAFTRGKPSPLTELPVQYVDFSIWQRQWLEGEVLRFQLSYWRRRLGGMPRLRLPTDRPRPEVPSYRGATHTRLLASDLSTRVQELASRRRATRFMVLLAAFKSLLHHWCDQDDIAVGTDVANRKRVETEGLIGFFINNLVLRTDFAGDPPFDELLEQVREGVVGAYENQDVPFEKLVDMLEPERDLRVAPLFQVLFVFEEYPQEESWASDLEVGPFLSSQETSKFDLALFVHRLGDGGLVVSWTYRVELFEVATVERLARSFETLLASIVANPGARLSTLEIRSREEKQVEQEQEQRRKLLQRRLLKTVQPKPVRLATAEVARSRSALAEGDPVGETGTTGESRCRTK